MFFLFTVLIQGVWQLSQELIPEAIRS